jgi:outer membrane lipoprotein-sorting protein
MILKSKERAILPVFILRNIGRGCLGFLLLWFCPRGAAGESGNVPTTDTASQGVELIRRLEAKYMKTMTFYGEFNQTKVSKLFLEEIRSKGKFWYQKPGKFRCEYLPPNAQVNLLLDDVAYVYIPDIKQVEVYHFKTEDSPVKKLNQMLLGFGVSVKDVLEVYDVHSLPREDTEDSFSLLFKLKKKEEGINFESINLSVRKKDLLPLKLVFIEPGAGNTEGDKTEILLKSVKFNEKIDESFFKPDFPKDAEVIEQN